MAVVSTTVTATDDEDGSSETVQITDNYVLVRDGSAHISNTTWHYLKDGTVTHVITVKGCRQRPASLPDV